MPENAPAYRQVRNRRLERWRHWFYETEWPFILPWVLFAVGVVVVCAVAS